MKQTETYKLNLIDRDDDFSPEALNANAQTLEKELVRVDAALLAERSARESADAAKAPQTEIARLETALAQRPRMVTGTYTGAGTYGADTPNKLDFADTLGCAPTLLIIGDSANLHQLVMVKDEHSAVSFPGSYPFEYSCCFTWTETGVEWYNTVSRAIQLNEKRLYYYVAFA